MEITLYKTSEENNKIDKTLSEPYNMTGSLRNESSVIRPSILVEIENPTNYNYMYIPDFGRYYFIKEMTSVRTNLWRLDCEVDVLKSYANVPIGSHGFRAVGSWAWALRCLSERYFLLMTIW